VYGAALATHTGMVFAAPVFLMAVAGPHRDRRGMRRLAAAAAGSLLVPSIAVAWVAWVLPREGPGSQSVVAYLQGIAPLTGAATSLGSSFGRTLAGVLQETVRHPAAAWMIGVLGLVACARRPRTAAFWIVLATPYLAYETWIGWNVDPGVHLLFAGPAIAALLGIGAAEAARLIASRRPAARFGRHAGAICAVLACVPLTPALLHSLTLGDGVVSRATWLSSEPARSAVALRSATPPEAVIVQPPDLDNVNLIPAYAARRPVIHQEGRYLLFEGGPGAPLNLSSYAPLTRPRLERLLADGRPVLSLVDEPFPVGGMGLVWRREGSIYRLERAPRGDGSITR
jgi:hypothetical protein